MAGQIDARLTQLGITLPEAAAPLGNYVAWVKTGTLVFVSGQLPIQSNGRLAFTGRIAYEHLTVEQGIEAARLCAINMLAQVKAACGGDLDKVVRVVRLGGFVACDRDFMHHPHVINGASDLMVDVFGDAGRHTRAAVGCSSLPLHAPVEIDAVFEVAD